MKSMTIAFEVKNWSADKIEELVQKRIDKGGDMLLQAGPGDYVYVKPILVTNVSEVPG